MKLSPEGVAIVEGDSHLSKWIVEHKTLQVQRGFLEFFRHHIPVGSCVVDVGACLGDHTATYSDFVGPAGKVVAFEPNPVAFECLAYNMGKYPNVKICNVGLGDHEAKVGMDMGCNLGGTRLVGKGDIPVITLDSAMEYDQSTISFIKLDCEGYEAAVLRGGQKTINKYRPVMLIELNPKCLEFMGEKKEAIYEELTKLNYRWQPCEPHFSLEWDKISDHVDILCFPDDLTLQSLPKYPIG